MSAWEIIQIPHNSLHQILTGRAIFEEITGGKFAGPPEFWYNINPAAGVSIRGEHLHKPFSKTELVIALGKCLVSLHSKNHCENILLEDPFKAILIPPGTWHGFALYKNTTTLHFSSSLADIGNNHSDKPCNHP